MTEQCFLGVDLGAESGRVIAGLFDGSRVKLESLHRFSNGPVTVGETLRWDVLRLWTEIQQGLSVGGQRFGQSIRSVGVDTWGVDFALLGKNQELLSHPYNYRDPRTKGLLNATLSRVPRAEIFAATGLQFMEINTLYQLIALQQQNPEILALAERLLLMPDLFHWMLSGSQVVEFTNATTTQFFNPPSNNWAFDLLGKLNVPTQMLGEVVQPGTVLGKLRPNLANKLGLGRIDVVAPATHDTGAAVAAIPTQLTGTARWAYISSGTWSLIGVEVKQAVLSQQALQRNVTNEGGIDGTYRLLKNIMGMWLVEECRRSFDRHGRPLDYPEMVRQAEAAPAFRSLIDPDDPSFLAPEDMPAAIRTWCEKTQQPAPETSGQMIRCVLESLALKYRVVLGWLEELTGEQVEVIHVVGGGCQNVLLNQFTANACETPVIAGPVEATALGNVLIQARATGAISSLKEIREVVRASTELKTFEPASSAEWQQASRRFQELLERPK
ncbi:MAG: rhaB [Planctomycetaceae bacterium]|nr:rhaB [Planctomycetaceae bacterium]